MTRLLPIDEVSQHSDKIILFIIEFFMDILSSITPYPKFHLTSYIRTLVVQTGAIDYLHDTGFCLTKIIPLFTQSSVFQKNISQFVTPNFPFVVFQVLLGNPFICLLSSIIIIIATINPKDPLRNAFLHRNGFFTIFSLNTGIWAVTSHNVVMALYKSFMTRSHQKCCTYVYVKLSQGLNFPV